MTKRHPERTGTILLVVLCMLLCPTVQSLAESIHESFRVPQRNSGFQIPTDQSDLKTADIQIKEKKTLTVMVYMCGSDLESDYGCATNDISEMVCSGFNTEKVQVLVMTGGSQLWHIPELSAQQKNIWELHPEILYPLYYQVQPKTWEEYVPLLRQSMVSAVSENPSSMGAPRTLTEFLDFAHTYYPSDRYALILWDHGGGPNNGVCVDRNFSNDIISIAELRDSLAASCFAREPLEWIGFDACMMASAEVALQISPYANYMIASEASEPGIGWCYDFLNEIESAPDGLSAGKRVIDCYYNEICGYYKLDPERPKFPVTLSCVDLRKMNLVQKKSEPVFLQLRNNLTENSFTETAMKRRESIGFGQAESENAIDMDLVDLGCFIDRTAISEEGICKDLKDAVREAVVYSKSNIANSSGLTVYFPYYSAEVFPYYEQEYQKNSLSGSYYDYIKYFNGIQTGRIRTDFRGIITEMPVSEHRDMRTNLSVTLNEEQMNSLSEAHLLIFEKDAAKDAFALVSYVPEVRKNEGVLTSEYIHRALFITDDEGNRNSPALPYTVTAEGCYTVEATLIRNDDAKGEAFRKKALVYLLLNDKTGNLTIEKIYGYDDFTGTFLPRSILNPEDFDQIEFTRSLRTPKEFGNGTLCAWEEWEEKNQEAFVMSLKNEKLMMLHNKLEWDALNAGFLLNDYQNNNYISALICLGETSGKDQNTVLVQYDDLETAIISDPQLKAWGNGTAAQVNLSMEITNMLDTETVFSLENMKINGAETDLTTKVYGTGVNGGLPEAESQTLMLIIPTNVLISYDKVTSITFDLIAEDALSREIIGQIPVTISLNQDLPFLH